MSVAVLSGNFPFSWLQRAIWHLGLVVCALEISAVAGAASFDVLAGSGCTDDLFVGFEVVFVALPSAQCY